MIYLLLLIFFVIYFIWTIFIFKKRDLMYMFFWLFFSFLFFLLVLLLLMGNSFSQEDKYIQKIKEKYSNVIDSSETKIFVNEIYDSDNEIRVFLKNFKRQTRFSGVSYGEENIKIKIIDKKGEINEIIFYVNKTDKFCDISLKKENDDYFYLGTKEKYCYILAEKYLK